MRRFVVWVFAGCVSAVMLAGESAVALELTAEQIVEKNVAARGGLEAWRKIQTMVWIGHIEKVNADAPSLSFVLQLKRPNKTRFEIKAQDQMRVRIFDGAHGWKLRQASNGMPELQAYTAEELNFAQDGNGIDGPLMDYQTKGTAVTLDGVDNVDGRKAYRLDVKMSSGASRHVWIDAQTFLDVKYARKSRNAFGQSGSVTVSYHNYQTIDGLQIPLMIESGSGLAKATDKMVIDKILLNPPLEDLMFAKPSMPGRPESPQALRPVTSMPSGLPRLNPRSMHGPGVAD